MWDVLLLLGWPSGVVFDLSMPDIFLDESWVFPLPPLILGIAFPSELISTIAHQPALNWIYMSLSLFRRSYRML